MGYQAGAGQFMQQQRQMQQQERMQMRSLNQQAALQQNQNALRMAQMQGNQEQFRDAQQQRERLAEDRQKHDIEMMAMQQKARQADRMRQQVGVENGDVFDFVNGLVDEQEESIQDKLNSGAQWTGESQRIWEKIQNTKRKMLEDRSVMDYQAVYALAELYPQLDMNDLQFSPRPGDGIRKVQNGDVVESYAIDPNTGEEQLISSVASDQAIQAEKEKRYGSLAKSHNDSNSAAFTNATKAYDSMEKVRNDRLKLYQDYLLDPAVPGEKSSFDKWQEKMGLPPMPPYKAPPNPDEYRPVTWQEMMARDEAREQGEIEVP